MKIATWNVNSLKVRLPQVLEWLDKQQVDILCLQETKLENAAFPQQALADVGYHAVFSGQKTYNGVAILAKQPLQAIECGMDTFEDPQQRLISASVAGLRVVCAYFPNGQSLDSDKYQYKLKWLAALHEYMKKELQKHPRLLLLGDYNIAPEDRDVHDPLAWRGQVLCSEPERAAFQALIDLGLVDAYRQFEQAEKSYSWWDYRMQGFRRNHGMRIDHILLSTVLSANCRGCEIDKAPRKLERPSDHAPVMVTLDLS